MALLHTTPLVQLLLHIDTSRPLSPILYFSEHFFRALQAQYPSFILCTTSLSHPQPAATCDPRYLKQSTSSNGSPFSITCIRSPLPYLEHLIILLKDMRNINFKNLSSNFSKKLRIVALKLHKLTRFLSPNLSIWSYKLQFCTVLGVGCDADIFKL